MKPITIEQIKKDLETAVYVERLMPPVRPPKYRCCMPEIVYTPQEIAFMDRRPVPPHPTQEEIAIWETVILEWLPILTPRESRLVWKRASHIPWKLLSIDFGIERTQIWKVHRNAINKIYFFNLGKKCGEQKRSGHFSQKSL